MGTLRPDPYLWWHFAGVATLPLWLDGCLAGLAVGDPAISVGVELGLLILLGTTPLLGLQWFRPLYLFRVGPLALSTEALTAAQTRLLTLQRSWLQKGVALCTALGLAAILIVLYRMAPVAAAATPFASIGRTSGWLLCAACFLLANWFGQTAMSALGLLLARDRTLERTQPYELTKITHDFVGVLIQVGQILPKRWLEETPTGPLPAIADSDLPLPDDDSSAQQPPELENDNLNATEPTVPPTEATEPNSQADDFSTSQPQAQDADTLDLDGDPPRPQPELAVVEVIEADQAPHSSDSAE